MLTILWDHGNDSLQRLALLCARQFTVPSICAFSAAAGLAASPAGSGTH